MDRRSFSKTAGAVRAGAGLALWAAAPAGRRPGSPRGAGGRENRLAIGVRNLDVQPLSPVRSHRKGGLAGAARDRDRGRLSHRPRATG